MGRVLADRIGLRGRLPLGEEAMIALSVAAGDLGSVVGKVLDRHGMTHHQYNALRMLRGAGVRGLAHGEIGERLLVRAPDVTRLMDRLVERGWVERAPSERDRRVVLHRITNAGRAHLERLAGPLRRCHEAIVDTLGPQRTAELVELCEEVVLAVASGRIAARPDEHEGAG